VQSLHNIPFGLSAPVSWRRRWLGGWTYWICQLVGWGSFILNNIVTLTANGTIIRDEWIIVWTVYAAAGLVASHLLRVVLFTLRERLAGWRLAVAIALCTVVAAAAMIGPKICAILLVAPRGRPITALDSYLVFMGQALTHLGGWIGFYFAITFYRNYRDGLMERLRLAAALKEAEVRALKAQLNPHFLFNSLNSLRALIPSELERPREAVTRLADLLRASLTVGQQATVPLERELETVDNFLALEQLRYAARLRVSRRIASAAREWPVPPFLVQSLVENAVKYGIAPREDGGEISLTAELHGDVLHLGVTNPGRIAGNGDSTGLGLKNARTRLHHLFGPAAQLTVTQRGADLVAAEVTIPRPVIDVP
jgi:hypothetical protein